MIRLYFIVILTGLLKPFSLSAQEAGLAGIYSDTTIVHCSKINSNTSSSDFGVVKYKSGYVFSSSRNNQAGIRYYSENELTPLLDLYYFEKKDSGNFSKPKPFAKELNSRYNDGPATFSQDGNTIVMTRNLSTKEIPGGVARLTLVISNYQNGKWTKPMELDFCEAGFNYTHPSLSPGDSILFFASDKPGGFGGLDIYYVKRSPAGWGKPINPGKKINSAYDEEFPFCSASGNLYFDSNRPGGKGMLDIYAWDIKDSLYAQPMLIGGSINSAADDFSFWCSADETEGFFSSNRNAALADDDIYFFKIDWPSAMNYDTLKKPELCYEFFEEASAEKVDTVDMAYQWTFSDGTIKNGYKVFKCFDTTGVYTVSLDIRDSSSGELFISNRMTYELEISHPNPIIVPLPDTVFMNQPFVINAANAIATGYKVSAVYYDFGNGYRSEGETASHTYHREGIYYPQIFFRVRDEATGLEECRCVVKKIIVE